MTGPALAPESPDLVWFEGSDAVRFLNDLISKEISELEEGAAVRSLLLSPQGKLDHILWVLRNGDRVGLVTAPGRGEDLAATLGRFRIRVDVEISVSTEPLWLVVGDYPGVDVSLQGLKRTLVFGERPDLPGLPADDYERARIEAGEPLFGVDVDEKTIPQEVGGLVDMAVDFDKGCYLGQELVARINSRGGNVPRHLRLLRFSGEAPVTGTELVVGDKLVGTLTSASGELGLALVHRDVGPGDTVTAAGKPATVL